MANINIDIQPYESLQENVIFVDGLNLEVVKYKYPWLLNAKIQNALIGEDSNGIVWYRGDWLCGEWFEGTWYSGTFHTGTWLSGSFYSYQLKDYDIFDGRFNIISESSSFSKFESGYWVNGNFYNGTFGKNEGTDWTDYVFYSGTTADGYPVFRNSSDDTYEDLVIATWIDGIFHNGYIYDTLWIAGTAKNAYITNSQWMNGNFFMGTFNGHSWYNGNWFGGDFIKGVWHNGVFTQSNTTTSIQGSSGIKSRFGYTTTATGTTCEWLNGTWKKGEWYSGYVTDSAGNTIPSTQQNISIWYDGTWNNGVWYGGHFVSGTWKDGIWYGGIFGGDFATNWAYPQYVYTVIDGKAAWLELSNWTITGATNPIYASFSFANTPGSTDNLFFSGLTFNYNSRVNNVAINKIQVSITHQLSRVGPMPTITDYACLNSCWDSAVTHVWDYSTDTSGSKTKIHYFSNNKDIMINEVLPQASASTIQIGYRIYSSFVFMGFSDTAQLYDVQIRLYYYNSDKPKWENGTWYNGIFSGDSWSDGKFYKGIWRSGTMVKGDMGS